MAIGIAVSAALFMPKATPYWIVPLPWLLFATDVAAALHQVLGWIRLGYLISRKHFFIRHLGKALDVGIAILCHRLID